MYPITSCMNSKIVQIKITRGECSILLRFESKSASIKICQSDLLLPVCWKIDECWIVINITLSNLLACSSLVPKPGALWKIHGRYFQKFKMDSWMKFNDKNIQNLDSIHNKILKSVCFYTSPPRRVWCQVEHLPNDGYCTTHHYHHYISCSFFILRYRIRKLHSKLIF